MCVDGLILKSPMHPWSTSQGHKSLLESTFFQTLSAHVSQKIHSLLAAVYEAWLYEKIILVKGELKMFVFSLSFFLIYIFSWYPDEQSCDCFHWWLPDAFKAVVKLESHWT